MICIQEFKCWDLLGYSPSWPIDSYDNKINFYELDKCWVNSKVNFYIIYIYIYYIYIICKIFSGRLKNKFVSEYVSTHARPKVVWNTYRRLQRRHFCCKNCCVWLFVICWLNSISWINFTNRGKGNHYIHHFSDEEVWTNIIPILYQIPLCLAKYYRLNLWIYLQTKSTRKAETRQRSKHTSHFFCTNFIG